MRRTTDSRTHTIAAKKSELRAVMMRLGMDVTPLGGMPEGSTAPSIPAGSGEEAP